MSTKDQLLCALDEPLTDAERVAHGLPLMDKPAVDPLTKEELAAAEQWPADGWAPPHLVQRLLETIAQLTQRGDALASRLEESVLIIEALLADNEALCRGGAPIGLVLTCAHYRDPATPCQRCTRDGCAPCELCEWCQPKGDEL